MKNLLDNISNPKDLKKLSRKGISQNSVNRVAKQDAISNHKNTAGNLFDICKSER